VAAPKITALTQPSHSPSRRSSHPTVTAETENFRVVQELETAASAITNTKQRHVRAHSLQMVA
jgi:hypothetical protein